MILKGARVEDFSSNQVIPANVFVCVVEVSAFVSAALALSVVLDFDVPLCLNCALCRFAL